MLQPMLLLAEIVLVAAAGYVFWLTRRQMAEIRRLAAAPSCNEQSAPDRTGQIEMMHDLADVLNEAHSTVQDMRAEWQRERRALQHQLEQAEKTIAEMRAQMTQARTQLAGGFVGATVKALPGNRFRDDEGDGGDASHASHMHTLGAAVQLFTDQLADEGLSESRIKQIAGSIREFAVWLGDSSCTKMSLDALGDADIERFTDQLHRRGLQRSTITRKVAAVKRFLIWSCSREPRTIVPTATVAARQVSPKEPAATNKSPGGMVERRAAVLALADQGLDIPSIAARLGLERDTVRMLLVAVNSRRPGGSPADRWTLNLGTGLAAQSPQVVHRPLS